jgi:DNA-directed RNA polymerase specialized sigma24 family protein
LFVFLVVILRVAAVRNVDVIVKAPDEREFEVFLSEVEPDLRRALFAFFGYEEGREATAEALAWAWEHWSRINRMKNPTGYLFRVGQSRSRRRKVPAVFVREEWSEPWVEPKLGPALSKLSEAQRIAVVLVHGFGWTMREVADLTGTKVTSTQTHLERGLAKLRAELGVNDRG